MHQKYVNRQLWHGDDPSLTLSLSGINKREFISTIEIWFNNCGRFANDQFANVLVVFPTSQVSLLRLIGRFANLII